MEILYCQRLYQLLAIVNTKTHYNVSKVYVGAGAVLGGDWETNTLHVQFKTLINSLKRL